MKRKLALLLLLLTTLSILAACTAKPKTVYQEPSANAPAPAQPAQPVTLKIGQLPIADGLPFWVAEQKQYYKDAGVTVELVTFKSANERDAAIMGGQVDGMLADLVASSSLLASGTKIQIASLSLGVTPEEGPMAIVAAPNSGITEIAQLKGVDIGNSTNSVTHYVMDMLLTDAGFKAEEIKLTPVPQIPLRFESLMSGKVKAVVLPDPLLTLATGKGAKVLATDVKAKHNYSQSVIVFTEKSIKEKADGITRMFNAYNRAVVDIKLDPNSFRGVLMEKAGLPAELKDIYQVVPFSGAQPPKQEDVERVVQWLLDKQVIKSKVTYEQLVNPNLLPK